jgi:hypothetical protein
MKNPFPCVFRLVLVCLFISLSSASRAVPKLNSWPGAIAVIFLDFDGQFVVNTLWNNANAINCSPAAFTELQITEVFNRVAEDYRPFDLNITTDSLVFLNAPLNKRMRVIVTQTSNWYPGVGGVAWVNSFRRGDDTPCFVFADNLGPDNTKWVAEACSHESGHTLGLIHQSQYDTSCRLLSVYNPGAGSGQTGWAPIMGISYGRNFSLWNNGPTQSSCSLFQDNLSVISGENGFGYRADDYADGPAEAMEPPFAGDNFKLNGLIGTVTDKDVFRLNFTRPVRFNLQADPYSIGANNEGADLDLKLTLMDSGYKVIRVYDSSNALDIRVDTSLYPGSYFIAVEGTGNANSNGDYGSLGSYTISGGYALNSPFAIREVSLMGTTEGYRNVLKWKVESDEPIRSFELEAGIDSKQFKTLIQLPGYARQFAYQPFGETDIYYRLKVTSIINEVHYSNPIILKNTSTSKSAFIISTLVQEQLMINASRDYQYQLTDISGAVLAKGRGSTGIQYMNMSAYPKGIYLLQLLSKDHQQVERIIRQ